MKNILTLPKREYQSFVQINAGRKIIEKNNKMVNLKLLIIAGVISIVLGTVQEYFSAKTKKLDVTERTTDRCANIIVFCVHLAIWYALIDYYK